MGKNTIEIIDKEMCCGCTACETICPVNAIRMISDEQGFLYPKIQEGCIHCGQCLRVCQLKDSFDDKNLLPSVYAVKHTDENIRKKSSSGAISYSLCSYVIKLGGYVYGVAYDKDYHVITKKAETLEECMDFSGSKYVQTDLQECFNSICSDLLCNRTVLFFGTSCHVAGLKALLKTKGIPQNNLITIDLICHGVPSPGLFSEFIGFINRNNKLEKFEFRTKQLPWINKSENLGSTITYKNGKRVFNTSKARMFLNLFESNNCLRPYCFSCPYSSPDKPSDITIGDYWGIQDIHPDFYDQFGVSGVIIHSQKGKEIFNSLQNIIWIESTIDNLKKNQLNLSSPSRKPDTYDDFWKLYSSKGYLSVCRKYGKYSFKARLKRTSFYKVMRSVKKLFH